MSNAAEVSFNSVAKLTEANHIELKAKKKKYDPSL